MPGNTSFLKYIAILAIAIAQIPLYNVRWGFYGGDAFDVWAQYCVCGPWIKAFDCVFMYLCMISCLREYAVRARIWDIESGNASSTESITLRYICSRTQNYFKALETKSIIARIYDTPKTFRLEIISARKQFQPDLLVRRSLIAFLRFWQHQNKDDVISGLISGLEWECKVQNVPLYSVCTRNVFGMHSSIPSTLGQSLSLEKACELCQLN